MHIGEAMKKEMVAYLRLEILYKLHKYWSTFIFRRPLFEDVKSMNHAFCEFFHLGIGQMMKRLKSFHKGSIEVL